MVTDTVGTRGESSARQRSAEAQASRSLPTRGYRLASLLVPFLIALLLASYWSEVVVPLNTRVVVPILNLFLVSAVPLTVAFLASRTFLARDSMAVLWMGCGSLSLGVGSALSSISLAGGVDANVPILVHNLGLWLASLFYVLSAVTSVLPSRSPEHGPRPLPVLVTGYAGVAGLLLLVAWAAVHGSMPTFFIPGSGPTMIRQVVLASACTMLAVSSILFRLLATSSESLFLKWYSLSLVLIAVGTGGIMYMGSLESLEAWVARGAQQLGCVYMLIAILAARSESGAWELPLERALREVQDRYRSLLDVCPDGIAVHVGGVYVFANPTAARLFGASTAQDVVGRRVLDLVAPEDRDSVASRVESSLGGRMTPLKELRLLRLDGSVVDAEATGIGTEYQGQRAVQVVLRDMSSRKQAEAALKASEERYRALFSEMSEGFALHEVICDEQGTPVDYRFLEVNPAFERLTGLKREDVVGRTVTEVLPQEDPEFIRIYGKVGLTGESLRFDCYSQVLKRHFGVFSYRPAPEQFAVIFTDITDRKTLESEREEYLRQAVESRAEAETRAQQWRQEKIRAELAVEELARSNRDLEQFAYACSHDLQEPLRMVTGFVQLFQQKYEGRIDAQGDEYIAFAVDGARRMQDLINDLLAYARVGSGGAAIEAVGARVLLERALQNLTARIVETQAEVTYDSLPVVHCDPVQLVQVFQNLVGNALKFRSDRTPCIRVQARREGPMWVFSVQDNGIGIDPKFHDRIFKIFQRLHTRRESPGTGIGLALCQKIVERHGGRIWVESSPGQGSAFQFTLPAAQSSEEES